MYSMPSNMPSGIRLFQQWALPLLIRPKQIWRIVVSIVVINFARAQKIQQAVEARRKRVTRSRTRTRFTSSTAGVIPRRAVVLTWVGHGHLKTARMPLPETSPMTTPVALHQEEIKEIPTNSAWGIHLGWISKSVRSSARKVRGTSRCWMVRAVSSSC
jgi:hypothetical protein